MVRAGRRCVVAAAPRNAGAAAGVEHEGGWSVRVECVGWGGVRRGAPLAARDRTCCAAVCKSRALEWLLGGGVGEAVPAAASVKPAPLGAGGWVGARCTGAASRHYHRGASGRVCGGRGRRGRGADLRCSPYAPRPRARGVERLAVTPGRCIGVGGARVGGRGGGGCVVSGLSMLARAEQAQALGVACAACVTRHPGRAAAGVGRGLARDSRILSGRESDVRGAGGRGPSGRAAPAPIRRGGWGGVRWGAVR